MNPNKLGVLFLEFFTAWALPKTLHEDEKEFCEEAGGACHAPISYVLNAIPVTRKTKNMHQIMLF